MLIAASVMVGAVAMFSVWHEILRPLNQLLTLSDDLNGIAREHQQELAPAAPIGSNSNDLGNLFYSVARSDTESRAHDQHKSLAHQ